MTNVDSAIVKAEELAAKYNPDGLVPFPFQKILEDCPELRIKVHDELPPSISGVTVPVKAPVVEGEENLPKYYIFVNAKDSQKRQYFTIAHELGHFFLHLDMISEEGLVDRESFFDLTHGLYRLTTDQRLGIETEANNFAASLLMPEKLVIKAWESLHSVEECAKLFKVSVSAMSIRLERLSLVG